MIAEALIRSSCVLSLAPGERGRNSFGMAEGCPFDIIRMISF